MYASEQVAFFLLGFPEVNGGTKEYCKYFFVKTIFIEN